MNPTIDVGSLYIVVGIEGVSFRVVDSDGEPILIPIFLFEVVDDWVPEDWAQKVWLSDDWTSFGAPELMARGFFEDWHDGDTHVRRVFAGVYEKLWSHYAELLIGQPYVLKDGT
ncbi:hypothetical protein JGU66_32030 [Myxococcaceae bacterium JPH2]|nr:hypothetical protein [Myxococcaceae bacterium JPH2]